MKTATGWMKRAALALLVACVLNPAASRGADPALPTGLVWEELREIHASVPRPGEWFVRREIKPTSASYFFSKEKIVPARAVLRPA